MGDLKLREMKALKIAEENRTEGIWAYDLGKNHGWKSVGTAHDNIRNLKKLGFVQPQDQAERGKKPYLLAPGLHVVTSKPKTLDLPIKTVNSQDASRVHFVIKMLAQRPGTALFYVGSASATS